MNGVIWTFIHWDITSFGTMFDKRYSRDIVNSLICGNLTNLFVNAAGCRANQIGLQIFVVVCVSEIMECGDRLIEKNSRFSRFAITVGPIWVINDGMVTSCHGLFCLLKDLYHGVSNICFTQMLVWNAKLEIVNVLKCSSI